LYANINIDIDIDIDIDDALAYVDLHARQVFEEYCLVQNV